MPGIDGSGDDGDSDRFRGPGGDGVGSGDAVRE
jgi:hypothetical protein